jgi:hypothetical protein
MHGAPLLAARPAGGRPPGRGPTALTPHCPERLCPYSCPAPRPGGREPASSLPPRARARAAAGAAPASAPKARRAQPLAKRRRLDRRCTLPFPSDPAMRRPPGARAGRLARAASTALGPALCARAPPRPRPAPRPGGVRARPARPLPCWVCAAGARPRAAPTTQRTPFASLAFIPPRPRGGVTPLRRCCCPPRPPTKPRLLPPRHPKASSIGQYAQAIAPPGHLCSVLTPSLRSAGDGGRLATPGAPAHPPHVPYRVYPYPHPAWAPAPTAFRRATHPTPPDHPNPRQRPAGRSLTAARRRRRRRNTLATPARQRCCDAPRPRPPTPHSPGGRGPSADDGATLQRANTMCPSMRLGGAARGRGPRPRQHPPGRAGRTRRGAARSTCARLAAPRAHVWTSRGRRAAPPCGARRGDRRRG